MAISDDLKDKKVSANAIKDTADLSYRQLNDWTSKGVIDDKRKDDSSWRKFNGNDVIRISLLSKIRDLGADLDSIKRVNQEISQGNGHEAFINAIKWVGSGLRIYFHTDLKTYFEFINELEMIDQLTYGIFADGPLILVQLHPIVNEVVKKMGLKELEPADYPLEVASEKFTQPQSAPANNINEIEEKIIKALRERDYQTLTIKVKDGNIVLVNREEGIYYQSSKPIEKNSSD